ncbi:hypothetical protein K435DRAFT_753052 [Dendrothele bispora CBS 962.96]|uniref:Uncharacterized protein n=1 Tax=Dendrothele bispora (strain CBS 962.96) TaxID=1314807 RepID=A0A4S8M873_DENBC|nr:hypothetical protein K435DRAFT_753052 [Dendrothele bispora CBS 962.96]
MTSSTSSVVQIILDHTSPFMTYSPSGAWRNESSQLWYGGTSFWAVGTNNTRTGSMSVSFQGIDIAFFGNTPPADNALPFVVTIDSETNYNATYPEIRTNCQWFTSYALDDSKVHTVEISALNQIDVDFVVVTVGNTTPLDGTTIIVDDLSEEITWNGQWKKHTGLKYVTGLDDGRPFGNGTRESNNVGDSMSFTFAGTNVALYGIFDWKTEGSVAVNFTVTNPTSRNSIEYSENKSFFIQTSPNPWNLLNSTNYPLFMVDSLSSGNHTLTLTVTEIIGSRGLTIDYLTYQPNFDNLGAKPNFSSILGDSGSEPGPSPTGGGFQESGISGTNTDSNDRKRSLNTGAIAGGVVGGVVLLAVTVALIVMIMYRRMRRSKLENSSAGNALIGGFSHPKIGESNETTHCKYLCFLVCLNSD